MTLRIPLIRFGKDDTPYAWWEWLFYPIVIIPIFFAFVLVFIALTPISVVASIAARMRDRKMRRQFIASGRFLSRDELKLKLDSGSGTLIVVHDAPKGPVREWWADEDLIANAPSPLPSTIDDCESEALISFAKTCLAKFVDRDTGVALLTDGTIGLVDSTVAATFPRAKIVTIFTWPGPVIAQGHLSDMMRRGAQRGGKNESG